MSICIQLTPGDDGADSKAFAKYNDQRQWIIEEILTSLVKLPDQKAQSEFQ